MHAVTQVKGGRTIRQTPQQPELARPDAQDSRAPSAATTGAPVLLTEDQAAAMLGVSRRTFLTLRTESWMPRAIALGPRLHRYALDELRAAVANMPRAQERPQPQGLLRARVERAKTTGSFAQPA